MFNESNIFQLTAIDEVHVEQNKNGHIVKQLCRIRVFFLSFLTGQFYPIITHYHYHYFVVCLKVQPFLQVSLFAYKSFFNPIVCFL
jgi:hypothetical protein